MQRGKMGRGGGRVGYGWKLHIVIRLSSFVYFVLWLINSGV